MCPPSLGLVEFHAYCCPGYPDAIETSQIYMNLVLDCILEDRQITVANSNMFGIICKSMI